MTNKTRLNEYYHHHQYELKEHNNGICDKCNLNKLQTFEHILYKCPTYSHLRAKLQLKLFKIDANYMRKNIFDNPINLIFPFKNQNLKSSITNKVWNQLNKFVTETELPCFQ